LIRLGIDSLAMLLFLMMKNRKRNNTVYAVRNKLNNKVYIGWTVNLVDRKSKHLRCVRDNIKTKFYNAIRKYGIEFFEWNVLFDNLPTIEDCQNMEKKMIALYDTYNNGYNATLGGDGGNTFNGSNNSGVFTNGHIPWHKGKKMSQEYCDTMSKAHNHECISVMQLNSEGNFINMFDSISQVKRKLNIDGVSSVLKGKCKTAGGFKWKTNTGSNMINQIFNSSKIKIIKKAFENYAIISSDGHGWFTKGKRSFTDPPFYENEFNSILEAKLMMLFDFCGIEYHQLSPGTIDTALGKRDRYEHELVKDILSRGKQPFGVSIHCDAYGTQQNDANGFCVYYYEKDDKFSETGKKIARSVASQIIKNDREVGVYVKPRHDVGICGANFLMLRETDAPWVLLENGFMTCDKDLKYLKNDNFRNNRALAILQGLYNYVSTE